MKPPFFVSSRPCRAKSCAGGNVPRRASLFPLHKRRNKAALKQSPVPPLVPWCRDASPLIVPFSFEEAVLLARAPTFRAITTTCFTQSPDLFARAPKGGRKIGNLLCKQGDFHSETPTFFSKSRHLFRHCATFLWNDSTSFAFPSLTSPRPLQRVKPLPPSYIHNVLSSMFTFRQFVVHDDRCAMKVGTDGVLLGAC